MTERSVRVAAAAAALSVAAILRPAHVGAQVAAGGQAVAAEPADLLDVPYLAQSEALCGGAAVAMVMRFWGERDIYAEEFEPYVDESGEGITTDDLVDAVRRHGWRAMPFTGTLRDLEHHLSRGRPIVVLIEAAPARFHYVVVVGERGDRVVYHDPAIGPHRRVSLSRFQRVWGASDRWAMLLLPDPAGSMGLDDMGGGRDSGTSTDVSSTASDADRPPAPASPGDPAAASLSEGPAAVDGSSAAASSDDSSASTGTDTFLSALGTTASMTDEGGGDPERSREGGAEDCRALATRAVRLAGDGEPEAAEGLLSRGLDACDGSPAVLGELGGLRFRQGRWVETARLAERAVAIDPGDDYAWELLAASRFRAGDRLGALDAWNRTGAPRVDLIDIRGLRRTRFGVVADRLGVAARDTLTRVRLRRARLRLRALPTVVASDVRYRPLPDGSVQVEAAVVERPPVVSGWTGLLGTAGRAMTERELRLPVASLAGGGSLITLGWRWWEGRPRLEASIAAPGPLGLPGVLELAGYWERQTYAGRAASGASGDVLVEERRRAGLRLAEWVSGVTRLSAGAGVDRWDGGSLRPSVSTGARFRPAGDELVLDLSAAAWPGLSGDAAFGLVGVRVDWLRESGPSTEWRTRAGVRWASVGSPPALRPGVGLREQRGGLLRAHPLLEDDVVRSDRVGQAVVHGGVEVTRWLWNPGIVAGGIALFADGARLWKPLAETTDPRAHVDVDIGAGLRLALPWSGRIRADVAVGLRDGANAVSVVWEDGWRSADGFVGR